LTAADGKREHWRGARRAVGSRRRGLRRQDRSDGNTPSLKVTGTQFIKYDTCLLIEVVRGQQLSAFPPAANPIVMMCIILIPAAEPVV